jgi:hypothetical protein
MRYVGGVALFLSWVGGREWRVRCRLCFAGMNFAGWLDRCSGRFHGWLVWDGCACGFSGLARHTTPLLMMDAWCSFRGFSLIVPAALNDGSVLVFCEHVGVTFRMRNEQRTDVAGSSIHTSRRDPSTSARLYYPFSRLESVACLEVPSRFVSPWSVP